MNNILFYCKFIIFFLVAITTIASTCYSNSNYKEFQYYLKQFDEGKTLKNKVISNLYILEKLLEQELFDSAQKRIQWHRENVKDGNFDERIKYYELLSLHKRGLIKENIPIDNVFFSVSFLKNLINAELKYKNNDFFGSYINILENLKTYLSIKLINSDSYILLSETYKLLFNVHQYDFSRAIISTLGNSKGPQGAYLNTRFEEFFQAVFMSAFYNNPEFVKYIDEEYEKEMDFIPAEAYRKYWYAKLVLAFRDQNSFYPMIKKLKFNNTNREGYIKIPEHIFAIFEAWFDTVIFNKLNSSKLSKLIEARDRLPKLDQFRLIADAMYLRSLMLKGNVENVIKNMTLLREKINKLVKLRKSISSENYYSINVADYVVNVTLFRAVEYLKQNNYGYEKILFDNMMGKHYQQSNSEVDNKYSLNKYDNKRNLMAVYSKFRLLNDLSKEIISRINNNPIPKIGSQQREKPIDYQFDTIGKNTLKQVEILDKWEQDINKKNSERLTLDLKNLKNNLHKNEVFFAFTHYGSHIAQYCTTRNYHYKSLKEIDTSQLGKSINNLKVSVSNPSTPYKYEDANTIYKTYFSLLDKCVKHDSQFVTILADPEIISIPINSLVVYNNSGDRKWFFEKYKYTLLPSPNYFFISPARVMPRTEYLGIGDPILSKKTKIDLNLSIDNLLVTRGVVEYDSIKNIPSLPETYDEIINTSKLFSRKKLLLKEKATEKNLRRLMLDDYKIIHFATHGLTSKSHNNLSLPGLIMTPVSDGPWFNDGYLDSNEIMQFSLSANLVILSACNTGIDKSQIYKFGFSDLTQSFLIAGAKNVLATQWSIPSKETQSLINKILVRYKDQQNLGIAYHNGLKDFLKINPKDLHPFYWASFLPIGRGSPFENKEGISIENIYAKGTGFENDGFLNASRYKDNIYAAGRSLTTSFSGVWDPILIKYNFVNEKLSEINIGEYETVRVGEVVNDNLILLLTNYSEQNGDSIYLAKYDLSKKQIEIIDKISIKPNMLFIKFGIIEYIFSTELKKHYLFTALSNKNSDNKKKNALLVYVYDKEFNFEKRIEIPFDRGPKNFNDVGITAYQEQGKIYFIVSSYNSNSRKLCNFFRSSETFIIDSENNYKSGKLYKNTVFYNKDPISGLIPVYKIKTLNDLPCQEEYFDIFDPKTTKFKNVNLKLPLSSSHLEMSYLYNKYIIHNQNRVLHGVDFDQLNKGTPEMYDNNLLLNYDHNKFSNLQSNIIILNDKFEIEKNISFPSKSITSIDALISADEDVYFIGTRENLMSIDKFSGF